MRRKSRPRLARGAGVTAGVDIVSVTRIEGMVARWGERFLKRIFTDGEIAYSMARVRPARSLAARFAAKEAFFKAVAAWHDGGMGHKSIEVVTSAAGAPGLSPHGRARKALGDRVASLSMSHEDDFAVALVVTSVGFGGQPRRAGPRRTGRRRPA